jgi:fatty-acyl-CoA synthase
VAAAVVPRALNQPPDRQPEPAALAAWCRERLAPYEVPKRWRLVAELPLTAAGKVRRHGVRTLFEH